MNLYKNNMNSKDIDKKESFNREIILTTREILSRLGYKKTSTEEAVEKLGWKDVKIIYNTNMAELIQRGITATPALAIDGKIVLSGRYLPVNKLVQLLQEKE